jgi:hypothetical protein
MLETIPWQRALLWVIVAIWPLLALTFTVDGAGWGVASMWLLMWPHFLLRHHTAVTLVDDPPVEDRDFWEIVSRG